MVRLPAYWPDLAPFARVREPHRAARCMHEPFGDAADVGRHPRFEHPPLERGEIGVDENTGPRFHLNRVVRRFGARGNQVAGRDFHSAPFAMVAAHFDAATRTRADDPAADEHPPGSAADVDRLVARVQPSLRMQVVEHFARNAVQACPVRRCERIDKSIVANVECLQATVNRPMVFGADLLDGLVLFVGAGQHMGLIRIRRGDQRDRVAIAPQMPREHVHLEERARDVAKMQRAIRCRHHRNEHVRFASFHQIASMV